jgi:hypothetical protein
MAVMCWMVVVGFGSLLGSGHGFPLVHRWKIFSGATEKFLGVSNTGVIRGDYSYESEFGNSYSLNNLTNLAWSFAEPHNRVICVHVSMSKHLTWVS